jgi:hypothetical protein
MHPQTLSAIPLEVLGPWLAIVGFGAYHGLNPGMGWLFALSLGLQQQSARALWLALLPIAAGHAASVGIFALLVHLGARFIPLRPLEIGTAALLLVFGLFKLFNYYRHPKWVGMKVGMGDLFGWSFLMATAHGAGLMVTPALLGVAHQHASHQMPMTQGAGLFLAVALHTTVMLLVMGLVAWIFYRKLSLAVLRRNWINFDLIWAVALLVVGGIALFIAY